MISTLIMDVKKIGPKTDRTADGKGSLKLHGNLEKIRDFFLLLALNCRQKQLRKIRFQGFLLHDYYY